MSESLADLRKKRADLLQACADAGIETVADLLALVEAAVHDDVTEFPADDEMDLG